MTTRASGVRLNWPSSDVVALICMIALAVLARGQTFGNPVLGYDEQFYLLMGDRMLHGDMPYVDVFDRKPVGLFLIFAAIRALGGDGFVQYKVVASLFAAITGYFIFRVSRPVSNGVAAGVAGAMYILWLNLMEGVGGQAQVFYNLPVLLAAFLTWRALQDGSAIGRLGCGAMLSMGIAIQIKYTAVFEGLFFGVALLWAHRKSGARPATRALAASLWIGLALLPTAAAALFYYGVGEFSLFFFANVTSNLGRPPVPRAAQLGGLAEIIALLAPLMLLALPNIRTATMRFVALWAAVAFGGMLTFGSFLSSQYGMNVIAPLCIAASPSFASARYGRWLGVAVLSGALAAGQLIIDRVTKLKGGAEVAALLTRYATPRQGCLYVYSGFPALYMLTHSCLPTRWAFPDHLSTLGEASAQAIGVDPSTELRRILSTRPETIVDSYPAFAFGNPQTHAILKQALAERYRLVARIPIGSGSERLVYRLRSTIR